MLNNQMGIVPILVAEIPVMISESPICCRTNDPICCQTFFSLQRETLEVSATNFWSKKAVFLMNLKSKMKAPGLI
jgi:hypothetical protein